METKTQLRSLRKIFPIAPQNKELLTHKMAIPLKNKIEIIDIARIIYLKSDSNYSEIHLMDGVTIVTSATLKKYEAKLNPQHFIRVHNSYIINKSHFCAYLHKESIVILRNTQKIPVSRSKKESLLNYLKTLMV